MSQPWRPSRGSGKSRWSSQTSSASDRATPRPNSSSKARPDAFQRPPISFSHDEIPTNGMRSANLRPVRDNVMDLSSPSRGETVIGKSLTNPQVQVEFRQHLEVKVKTYQTTFPDELGIVLSDNEAQKEQLDLILLDFRKLREGIVSSGRKDAFAIEVYETSAKLAILAKNTPQIATILPHLIKTLHWPKGAEPDNPSIEKRMSALYVIQHTAVSEDTRARFTTYYLLHVLWTMQDRPAFQSLLAELVNFEAPGNQTKTLYSKIHHSNAHIQFVLTIFRISLSNDYARLAQILQRPFEYDKFAWLLVRSNMQSSRTSAWRALKASYQAIADREWLCQHLLLPDQQALVAFLKGENWTDKVEANGTILLKRAK